MGTSQTTYSRSLTRNYLSTRTVTWEPGHKGKQSKSIGIVQLGLPISIDKVEFPIHIVLDFNLTYWCF